MSFNSSDYFAYKKNKMQSELVSNKEPISKFSFIAQLFIVTFIFMFVAIVFVIMRYSSKMDIEYQHGDLSFRNEGENQTVAPSIASEFEEEQQRTIDKRLMTIQQEENAPSEAKIIANKKANDEVIASIHVQEIKKNDKIEKFKAKNEQSEMNAKKNASEKNLKTDTTENPTKKDSIDQDKKPLNLKAKQQINPNLDQNVIISSKVLVGRFSSFKEASDYQEVIKLNNPSANAFVRKIGEVYTLQMGSYQDFYTAKTQAQRLKAKGFDVWIYQQ